MRRRGRPIRMEPWNDLTNAEETSDLTKLWILRLLAKTGCFHQAFDFENSSLSISALGLTSIFNIDDAYSKADSAAIKRELIDQHHQLEKRAHEFELPTVLARNLARLAKVLSLTEAEQLLLAFACIMRMDSALGAIAADINPSNLNQINQILGFTLDLSPVAVERALSRKGILYRSNLLQLDLQNQVDLANRLDLNLSGFAETIQTQDADPIELLKDVVRPAPPPTLVESDFPHLGQDLKLLVAHLAKSLETKRAGVNIFIHGVPGTGKTELSRLLGELLSCQIFEVSSEDDDGDPVDGKRRQRSLRAAQSFLANQKALLVFDEAEDLFSGDMFWILGAGRSVADNSKGWMTRTLENNTVPTIWLSNRISGLDPAYVRRFDMVLELPVPPRAIRQNHLKQASGDLLDDHTIESLAGIENLAPAVVARASQVVQGVQESVNAFGMQPGEALCRLIDHTLQAQGHLTLKQGRANQLPQTYDPALTPIDTDPTALVAGLRQSAEARICFYGPPGTGKTAFARWLAESLGKPLLMRRASDLMSMYVGQTERLIAQAFQQAEIENAVLLIDEVDSFLADRNGAQRSWEVTQVNEMLTQMESFSGIFIASTNLMDHLDPAAMRRFDLKLAFRPLDTEAAWQLFTRHSNTLELGQPPARLKQDLSHLRHLTPGDFAAVVRRHRFAPLESADAFCAALREEHAHKQNTSPPIGFVRGDA